MPLNVIYAVTFRDGNNTYTELVRPEQLDREIAAISSRGNTIVCVDRQGGK